MDSPLSSLQTQYSPAFPRPPQQGSEQDTPFPTPQHNKRLFVPKVETLRNGLRGKETAGVCSKSNGNYSSTVSAFSLAHLRILCGLVGCLSTTNLKQRALPSAGRDPEMLIRQLRGHAAARSAVQKANLHQKRLVNFFDRI